MEITLAVTFYENGGMLDRHFDEWANYSNEAKRCFRAIIVDDGSSKDPAVDHIRSVGLDVKLFKITLNIPWNLPGARNLAAFHAPEGWILLSDIDHLLTAPQAEFLIGKTLTPGKFYIPARRTPLGEIVRDKYGIEKPWHPNTYILERSLYWQCGGTDEDFSGAWGAGEQVFRKTICSIAEGVRFPDIHLTHYGRDDIADASTREWGRKNSPWDWRNNPKLVEKARQAPYKAENPLRFNWERLI